MQVDQKLIWTGIETSEQRIDALEGALEQKPECLLCADDSMAAAVLQELRARHIKQIALRQMQGYQVILRESTK